MGRPPEGRALWERLKIGKPFQESVHWAVSTPSKWAGACPHCDLSVFNTDQNQLVSRSGKVTYFVVVVWRCLALLTFSSLSRG